ncbi:uncharacterized protein LOC143049966 [Mytilus galloprovincialis]|uniref:uncharacterized protein LOC143049966 n=1 Tax=Mytilus galloprovincialis TaxID=29158 RepID=UPI003F7C1582
MTVVNMAEAFRGCSFYLFLIYFLFFETSFARASICENNSNDKNMCSYLNSVSSTGYTCETRCCDGWTLDEDGRCVSSLPPDYKKPTMIGCPRLGEHIPVYIGTTRNVGFLSRKHFHAQDWKGTSLYVGISKDEFEHCRCSSPYENVTATSEKDAYGNRTYCHFSVVIKDIYPPVYENCPKDQIVSFGENVTWTEPTVTDNVGVLYKNDPNQFNNTKLSPGLHCLVYNATDHSRNIGTCMFTINVLHDIVSDCRPRVNSSITISGTILGALVIILIVMTVILIPLCKRRRRRNQLQRQSRSASNSSEVHLFTVYNNEPPPYDVVVSNKLPEYSPPIEPPSYDSLHSDNAVNDQRGDNGFVLSNNAVFASESAIRGDSSNAFSLQHTINNDNKPNNTRHNVNPHSIETNKQTNAQSTETLV